MSISNLYGSLFTIMKLGLIYSICAVVWVTLMVGLWQLVRDKLHHMRFMQKRPHQLLQNQQVSTQ